MDAIVSGSAGVAVLLEGDRLTLIHAEDPGKVVKGSLADIHLVLGEGKSTEVLEDVCKDDVIQQLKLAHDRDQALHIFLILLDWELSDNVREEAAEAIEEIIGKRYVREQVESVLFAHELPKCIDIGFTFNCCKSAKAKLTESFLRRLIELQPYIVAVRRQWDAIPEACFGDGVDRCYIHEIMVREGCFRSLVEEIACGKNADGFLLDSMLKPSIKALRNNWEILFRWIEPFKSSRLPQPFRQAKEEERESKKYSEDKKSKYFSGDREEILAKVERQKEAIVTAMDSHNIRRIHKYTNDLIKYQVVHGGKIFACKSLCDLAMVAKELHMYDIQLTLTEHNINLKQDDGWSWAQYADALKCTNKPNESMAAYENAIRFGKYPIAQCGRAGVLKTLNRLDEALAAYDKIIAEHPYSVVAKNGRAEVLKSVNRLDEALVAYDKIIAEHPYDVVSQNGRAEVLKTLNRLDEALVAFDKIITEHPYDVIPQNGRAEVLKKLIRFDEAIAAYEKTIAEHPYSVFAKTGRAEVLKTLNCFDEALAAYDKIIAEHPYNVVAQTGRAEVLKSLNRLDEALVAFDKIIAEHPYGVVAQTGRAEVLKSLNHLYEALAAYDKVIAAHPYNVVAQTGRAEVLKSLNRLDEALVAFDKIIAEHPYSVVAKNGRAEVLKNLNRLDEALAAYDKIIAEHPYDVVPQSGRAEVLKTLNRLEEALVAYDKIIAEHPYSVFAQNGRAEVLKSLNRLEEALAAYDKIIAEHPYDVVSQTGRACVLAAMGRDNEALKLLPDQNIVTENEWIRYHIRGMILLRMGKVDLAIRIFEKGVKDNPQPADRDYFRTALAVARLSKREYRLASDVLEEITVPILQTASGVLKLHAYGRLGDCERTDEIYKTLPSKPGPALIELLSELHRQYVAYDTPRHKEEWLLEKEIQYLLLAA